MVYILYIECGKYTMLLLEQWKDVFILFDRVCEVERHSVVPHFQGC